MITALTVTARPKNRRLKTTATTRSFQRVSRKHPAQIQRTKWQGRGQSSQAHERRKQRRGGCATHSPAALTRRAVRLTVPGVLSMIFRNALRNAISDP